jgi:hypothetical protein
MLVRSRTGGKGTMRRKVVHKPKTAGGGDDKKLQAALKKLNVQPISGVEEVNMFREDGNVLHFSAPKGVCNLSMLRSPAFVASIRVPFSSILASDARNDPSLLTDYLQCTRLSPRTRLRSTVRAR